MNALVEETSLIATASHGTHGRGGRWFKHPAYLYCTCHTKLVTTEKNYVYDDNWQILSCTTEAADHQITKECYTYDEAGNRTSYERWNGHSKVEYIRYEYNSSNQLTTTYTQEGYDWFNTEKTLYTYDADGNLVKEEVEYRKYHDDDWYDDKHDNWWDNWFDDWFDWFGTDAVASTEAETKTEEVQESEGTSLFNFGLGNQDNDKDNDNDHHRPSYDSTYTTTTYAYDTENRLKAVREQGILLQAMTYDGDGNLAYELDYNVDAVVDGRCIYLPAHGTKAERELYRKVCDGYGWVRGNYTLTEYLNDVTRENVEVLAEYGRNYCSVTVYTYGNERISATTFNGYGYHFGCHDHGYHNIFTQYEKWHDRWQIKDHWHNNWHGSSNRPRGYEESYSNAENFRAIYGSYSSYHSGKFCGHNWKTIMSKIYYLYDGHGSVERVHGKDGSTFRLEYDTYGNLVAGIVEKWHVWYNDIFAHKTANIYAYSGERYNVISGLQFLRARWYDTDTGRFISEDSYLGTQANPLSRNRYIYTANNPVNYIDPSGHQWVNISSIMQQAVGLSCADYCVEVDESGNVIIEDDETPLAAMPWYLYLEPVVTSLADYIWAWFMATVVTVGAYYLDEIVAGIKDVVTDIGEKISPYVEEFVANVKEKISSFEEALELDVEDVINSYVEKIVANTEARKHAAIQEKGEKVKVPEESVESNREVDNNETSEKSGTSGGMGSPNGKKPDKDGIFKDVNLKKLMDTVRRHVFSDKHVKDGIMLLGASEDIIMNKAIQTMRELSTQNFFVNGLNQIRTHINGYEVEIRVWIENGVIRNFDMFMGWSQRFFENCIFYK